MRRSSLVNFQSRRRFTSGSSLEVCKQRAGLENYCNMAVKLRSVVVLCTLFTVLAAKQGVHGEGSHRHLARSGALRTPRADDAFNYEEGHANGPANWPGECQTGESQSPVDIVVSETQRMDVTEPLQVPDFNWGINDVKIVNDGHMVKLVPEGASGTTTTTASTGDAGSRQSGRKVKRSGRKAKSESSLLRGGPLTGEYNLKEVNFHWGATDEEGSEHAIDSTFYTMEMQMVFNRIPDTERRAFRDAHDDTAILVVFFKEAADDNPALVPVVDALPSVIEVAARVAPTDTVSTAKLLPVHREPLLVYYGSFTTPPCDETVIWIIFEEPVTVSSSQVEEFRKVKAADAGTGDLLKTNRRPLVARDPEASRIGVAVAVQVWPSLALFCSFILIFIN